MPKRDFTVTPMPAAPNSSGCVDNRGPGVMSSPGLPALRIPRNKLSTHSAHGAGGAGPPRRIPKPPGRFSNVVGGLPERQHCVASAPVLVRLLGKSFQSASHCTRDLQYTMLHRVASSLIDWVCSFDLIGECRPSSKVIDICHTYQRDVMSSRL